MDTVRHGLENRFLLLCDFIIAVHIQRNAVAIHNGDKAVFPNIFAVGLTGEFYRQERDLLLLIQCGFGGNPIFFISKGIGRNQLIQLFLRCIFHAVIFTGLVGVFPGNRNGIGLVLRHQLQRFQVSGFVIHLELFQLFKAAFITGQQPVAINRVGILGKHIHSRRNVHCDIEIFQLHGLGIGCDVRKTHGNGQHHQHQRQQPRGCFFHLHLLLSFRHICRHSSCIVFAGRCIIIAQFQKHHN